MEKLKLSSAAESVEFNVGLQRPLTGITFSDPSYGPEIWCRYDSGPLGTPGGEPWRMKCRAERFECGDGWSETRFCLALGTPAALQSIRFAVELESFKAPAALACSEEKTVGADTACVYLGPSDGFPGGGQWQPAEALYLASDGYFGSVFELRDGDSIWAVVLLGQADAEIVSPGELGDYLLGSFGADVVNAA